MEVKTEQGIWSGNVTGIIMESGSFSSFRRKAARKLFARQRLKNWSFDADILYLARLKGYQVLEIPVRWRNDERTKVRLWRDIVSSFLGLIQIRLNDLLGRYR